jgi:Domain of unknown function (DUF4265)
MSSEAIFSLHNEPAWRERSNFIINAVLPDESGRFEQLWALQRGDYLFELCCIPFFLYNVALGDLVETDSNYRLSRVVESSGRFVFRVWFGESFEPRQNIADELVQMEALVEWSSLNLLAVDAPDAAHAQRIADCLLAYEQVGGLVYETGRSA